MKSLFESLLRLYEFDGAPPAAPSSTVPKAIERRLPDLSAHDPSTFPYLP